MKTIISWSPVFARAAATVGVFSYMAQTSSWEFSFTHYVFVFVALHFLGVAPTPAIFPVMYKLYCSKLIGYNFLRLMMHPRQPKAHSKWMCGVRYLNKPQGDRSSSPSSKAEMCVVEGEVLEVLRQAARDAKKFASQYHVPVVVIPVAVLADNYAYAIVSFVSTDVWKLDTTTTPTSLAEVSIQCALVDPADPIFIMEAVSKLVGRAFLQAPPSKNDADSTVGNSDEDAVPTVTSVVVTHALTTHKHWDHAGGNLELVQFSQQGTLSVKLQDGSDHVVQVRPSIGSHTELSPMSPTTPVRISSTLRMIGSAVDLPDGTNVTVHGGDRVQLVLPPEWGSTLQCRDGGTGVVVLGAPYVEVIESPGHTEGSVVFLVVAPSLTNTEPTTDKDGMDLANKSQFGRSALFTGDCVFCGGCGAMFEVKKAEPVLQTYDAFHGDEFLVVPKPVQYKLLPRKSSESEDNNSATNFFSEGNVVDTSETMATLYKGRSVPKKLEPTEVLLYVGHEYTQRLFTDLAERSSKWVHSAPHYALAVSRRHDELKRLWSMVGDNACTVPSTLLCERRTNPLLSIERAVLLDLQKRSAASGDIERAVYLSENRRID